MLRAFSRIRSRLHPSRLECIASASGTCRPLHHTETCVSPSSSFQRPDYPLMHALRIRGIHVSSRPLVVLDTVSPSSQGSLMLAQRHSIRQQRYMSSSNNDKNAPNEKKPPKETKDEAPADTASSLDEPGRLSSIVRSVGPTLRKVTEWNVPDLVSVYAIVLLIALIIFSPYVVDQMKKAESQYIELDEYDPVAQMEKIVRYELFGEEALEEEYEEQEEASRSDTGASKSVDNTIGMAADVLQSEAIQEAIASLITRVLESVQFQNACQTLLKNLWNDLVNDPETTAQVVQLLNNAIQNKEIQRSVRRLVLQLIKDKEVYDELTRLLVRLGQEEEVLDATRSLLTESAHNALNDPEILDHSMEFATDVVGDDIVQRTSGEALRNTVTYAAGPGVSAFLSILGIGLVWFAISAFGKSRASEQEAAMVDKAVSSMARTLQSGTREGVAAIASLPARFFSMLATIITFPFRLAGRGISGLGKTGENIVSAISSVVHSVLSLPGVVARAAATQLERLGRSISERTSYTISRIGAAISASFVGPILRSVGEVSRSVLSKLSHWAEPVRHGISACVKALSAPLSKLSAVTTSAVASTGTCVNAVVAVSSRIAGNAAGRLSGLCSHYGALVKSGVILLAAKSEHAKTVTLDAISRFGARYGSVVKSGVVSLAAKSEHARIVTVEMVKRLGEQCSTLAKSLAGRSEHAQAATTKFAKDVGASLKVVSARVSSSLAAATSWCLKLFRGDDRNDSATTI